VKHKTTARFWNHFHALPAPVQEIARKNYQISERTRVILHYASRKLENFGQLGSAAIIGRSLWKTKATTLFGSGLILTKNIIACFMGSELNIQGGGKDKGPGSIEFSADCRI